MSPTSRIGRRSVAVRWTAVAVLGLAAVLATGVAPEAAGREPASGARRNHLAGEASPYLQMHVYNPVDWYPWGDEALSRARAEDKPIFLSVGYSTCYWCHVMERKVFSDPEIASLMNDAFVNVKVDREERPDIDQVYMQATVLLTGKGGWPNSVFLTPEAKPFFAGTYFPPADTPGRPGFPRIADGMAQRWRDDRGQVIARAERVAAAIAQSYEPAPPRPASFDPRGLLARAVASLESRFDETHGGFDGPTKFPSPHQLEILLAAHERSASPRALPMLRKTLDAMAAGGIHDHVGGGFHRYSTEPTWSVPHFEKMLYDNAQLLSVYARAHQETKEPHYRLVAEGIAAYLAREMTSPGGALFTAQDAEVEQEEGRSYVWTAAEIRELLGKGADAFLAVYELAPLHRDAPEPGVLRLRLPLAKDVAARVEKLAPQRAKLLAARDARPQPMRDDKVLAGWNGLAIRGLVDAGVALSRPDWVERGARAGTFVLSRLTDDFGELHRSYVAGRPRERAVLDDYAFLADGFVALYAATGEQRWLQSARHLSDRMLQRFEGPPGAGLYLSSAEGDLFVRPRVMRDGVTPSGNTVAFRVLRDLQMMTGASRYAEAAARSQTALGSELESAPATVGTAIRALAMGPQLPAPPLAQKAETPGAVASPLDRLPTGRDFVKGRVAKKSSGAVEVVLEIAAGWHVNANPASLEFLIPTRVRLVEGGPSARVVYPAGTAYHPRFSLEPLSVYKGSVRIEVQDQAPIAAGTSVDLTFQACDDRSCLPPETVRLTVP